MKKRPLCYVCLVFLLIKSVLLLLTGGQSGGLSADSIFQEEKEKEVILQGQVYQKTSTSKMQILYLKNNSINSQNESFYESKIIVYDKTFQNIAIGKTVKLRGKANVFETAHNPGNFDQRQYYAKQNIYGMVWGEQIMEVSGKTNRLMNSLYGLKQAWKEKLTETMGEKNGAVLSAILLSEKKEMDAEIKELYQKNGIGHVLAISGLHISFIGLSVYQIFRKVGSPYFVAGIGSGILLFLYVLMIGLSVSVIRAAIMLLLRIGADMTGRVYDMATGLFFAGAVTVLWQPLYLADAGFLLSYGAILGILTILPAIEKLFPCKYQIVKGMYASIGINLMLFPVLLYFYFEFPLYSLLLNIAVIPMMSWVLGLGLIGSLFLPICQPIGMVLVKVCGIFLELFEWMSRFAGRLPGARMVFGQPAWWQISAYYLFVFGSVILVLKCNKKELFRFLRRSVWCVFPMILFWFSIGHGTGGKLFVTVIDVGQGDGILLRGPKNGTYLIDGGSSDIKEVGKYRIEPFLKSQGIGTLDYVLISHGDSDHYSGVEEMITRQDVGVRIKNLVLPATYQQDEALTKLSALAKKAGIRVLVIRPGMRLQEGDLQVTCIQPEEEFPGEIGNASSMVLDICYQKFGMLCTGDVEEKGEEILLEQVEKKVYSVLKVAHHGSKNSTKEELLKIIQPSISLISAGKGNRYGHPHKETLERLNAIDSAVYSTIENGAITLKSDGNTLSIVGFH